MPTRMEITRQARTVGPTRIKVVPILPTLEQTCPDIVRRFPELKQFDGALARWREELLSLLAKEN